jgi:hypothetical protein
MVKPIRFRLHGGESRLSGYNVDMANIQLDDSLAHMLMAQASARGMTLEAYLQLVAERGSASEQASLSVAEVDRLIDEASVPGPVEGTYSRAEIYREHD